MANDLIESLADLKEQEVIELVKARLEMGEDPMRILEDARRALEIVGERFEDHTYFIPDLVYSGEIFKAVSAILKPKITAASESKFAGTYLIGTVAGDKHDIGKNMVVFLLEISGFKVYDLGVDVPAQKFVDAIDNYKPQLIGLSCLLTTSFDDMKDTVDAIKDAGLRKDVMIMIGGGVVDANLVAYVGADGYEPYASGAVTLSKKWLGLS